MRNSWLDVKDILPKSDEEVLTYFHDVPYEVEQFSVLTYYKKGDKFTCEEPMSNDVLGQIFGKYDRDVEEDGFYIFDCVDGQNCRWRKHADVITHWQPLLNPTGVPIYDED